MAGIIVKSLRSPDETRPFRGKGQIELVHLGDDTCALGTFEPGWRWSTNVQPIKEASSCDRNHFGYCLSGRMRIRMDDGEEREIRAGDTFRIDPGHDSWVVGDEKCVLLEFEAGPESARMRFDVEKAITEEPQAWMQ
jgi:hypothetical protein